MQPSRQIQSIGKNSNFVGAPIAVRIFEDFDPIARFLARLGAEGILVKFQHPEPPPFIPGHGHGIDHFRLGSEEADFKTGRQTKPLLRLFGRKGGRGRWRVRAADLFARRMIRVNRKIIRPGAARDIIGSRVRTGTNDNRPK